MPKVFFDHLSEGLGLFVHSYRVPVLHQEDALAVVARDAAKAYIVARPAYAAKDRPEITIETDTISRAVATKRLQSKRGPDLRPGRAVEFRPWGVQEFRDLDKPAYASSFEQSVTKAGSHLPPASAEKFHAPGWGGLRLRLPG